MKLWWRGLLWAKIWSCFDWWGSTTPTNDNRKPCCPKFSKPIRMPDYFTWSFSKKAYLLNSFFVWQLSFTIETYEISFGYCRFLQLFRVVRPLKVYAFENSKQNYCVNMQTWVLEVSTLIRFSFIYYIYIYESHWQQ